MRQELLQELLTEVTQALESLASYQFDEYDRCKDFGDRDVAAGCLRKYRKTIRLIEETQGKKRP